MKLISVTVENYRSIEKASIVLNELLDKSNTYTLIGINESGKTSFLSGLSLIYGGEVKINPSLDFFDVTKSIKISYEYSLIDTKEKSALIEVLKAIGYKNDWISKINFSKLISVREFNIDGTFEDYIDVGNNDFDIVDYSISEDGNVVASEGNKITFYKLISELFSVIFFEQLHHEVIFWKYDVKYLISEDISLIDFAENPEKVSIPLKNCFKLAGIENIKAEVNSLTDNPSGIANLVEKLGDKTTEHIKEIWPGHPVIIKFLINNGIISFLIQDEGVLYSNKKTQQRSDGFRQFLSFLLTISAENNVKKLSNTLLLLDEPETHLHPKGQEFFRDELIKISKGDGNNVVIFASHSNYMIDRELISRCFRVTKVDNKKTILEEINGSNSSYAGVNYEVFQVITTDYHNELYGKIQEVEGKYRINEMDDFLVSKGMKRDKNYEKINSDGTTKVEKVTFSTYIRNQIHHPENKRNKKYSIEDLDKSIIFLKSLL